MNEKKTAFLKDFLKIKNRHRTHTHLHISTYTSAGLSWIGELLMWMWILINFSTSLFHRCNCVDTHFWQTNLIWNSNDTCLCALFSPWPKTRSAFFDRVVCLKAFQFRHFIRDISQHDLSLSHAWHELKVKQSMVNALNFDLSYSVFFFTQTLVQERERESDTR